MLEGRYFLVRSCLLISLIKCLKGHKSLGSLCSVLKSVIVSGVRQTEQGTRSPIELFWTAKNHTLQCCSNRSICVSHLVIFHYGILGMI